MKSNLILILLISCNAFGQQSKIDSLFAVLKIQNEDTAKVNTLNGLADEFGNFNADTTIYFANKAMELATKLNYKMGIANAYLLISGSLMDISKYEDALKNSNIALKIYDQQLTLENITGKSAILKQKAGAYYIIGSIFMRQGNYPDAEKNYLTALKIRIEIGDKKGIAKSYNSIGNIYSSRGNYPEGLKNYFACLKISEEISDKWGIARSYINIGLIYFTQRNYQEALKNYFTALKIQKEIGNNYGISVLNMSIGDVYHAQGNYPEALMNYLDALKIQIILGDKRDISNSYINIGLINDEQGNYLEALKNYFAALKIQEETGEKVAVVDTYNKIGSLYIKQKKNTDASLYLNKALLLATQIGSLVDIKQSYRNIAALDSAQGNFKQAFAHHKLYITYRDSLFNEENTKKLVQTQMQYDFDKKETATQAIQEKKDAIALKEIQKQKLVRNSFIGGFAVVLLFAFVFFVQRNKISKARKISEVEIKRSEELLLNILPAEVAEELKQTGQCQAKTFSMVTVMFADFKDFTRVSEKVSAELLVGELNYCFSHFDNILHKHKIEKIKTVGDAYMCASGLPTLNFTHAFDVVTAAIEMKNFILCRKKEKEGKGEIAFEIRIGIHTGPVVAGIVGIKKYSYDIWGDTVNIAARMEQSCEPGNVNISGTTYELVKDKFTCVHRGKIEAKNKGEVDMYFVEGIL